MKKIFFYFVAYASIMSSCSKTSTNPGYTADCSGATKSFSKDVLPVIQNNCSGCHSQFSTFSGISANKANIRSRIADGSMPRGGSLTTAQKNAVVCWIDNGGANN